MKDPAAPGVIRMDAIWTQENELVENTFHYHTGATIDLSLLHNIATTYTTWVTAHAGIWHNACQLVKVALADLTSAAAAFLDVDVNPPINGTGGASALPNNVTFSLKRQTGLRGRGNRGRVYLIGLNTSQIATGSQMLQGSEAANYVLRYNQLLANMFTDNAVQEVILHRKLGTSTPVTSYVAADLFLDSQRRRLPGHNRHH